MADKSPHFSKDKKKGKTLQEKRAAKRQKAGVIAPGVREKS